MAALRENLRSLASPLDEFKARDSKYLPHGNGRCFLIKHLACFKYGHHVVVFFARARAEGFIAETFRNTGVCAIVLVNPLIIHRPFDSVPNSLTELQISRTRHRFL